MVAQRAEQEIRVGGAGEEGEDQGDDEGYSDDEEGMLCFAALTEEKKRLTVSFTSFITWSHSTADSTNTSLKQTQASLV